MNRLQRGNGKEDDTEVFAPVEIKHPGVLIPDGEYRAYCCDARIYRDGGFKRWTCLLDFDIFGEHLESVAKLPLWFNLGSGQKPHVTRRSNYLAAWIKANDGPPSRIDRISPNVFLRRMCMVAVALTQGALPRSVVKEIVQWDTGHDQSSTLASAEGSTQQPTQTADAIRQTARKMASAKAF